jgi:hypothetical protein
MKQIKQISDTIIEVDGVQYQVKTFTEPEPPKVPKWEDVFQEKGCCEGHWVDTKGNIQHMTCGEIANKNKQVYPYEHHAEASIALAQLLQLRDSKFYRNGWKPDWSDSKLKYTPNVTKNGFKVYSSSDIAEHFSFQDEETANRFMNDQAELLNIYKQLFD